MNYWEEKEKRQKQWLWLTYLIATNQNQQPKLMLNNNLEQDIVVVSTTGTKQEYDLFPNRLLNIAFKQNISFDEVKAKVADLEEQGAPINISLIIAETIGETYSNVDFIRTSFESSFERLKKMLDL